MAERTYIYVYPFFVILVALINSVRGENETCPDPGVSSDGTRRGDCCFIGDVVKYTCNKTYELVGKDSISCLPGGKWSAPRPLCRPPGGFCPDPPDITNGVVVGNNKGDYYVPKDAAEVVCNPGFVHDGEVDDMLCETTFEWEKEFGECRESFCKLPEFLENGSIPELESTNSTVFPYKFELSYVCNPGYRLIGQSVRFCNKGDWSGKAPYCEDIKCPDPGVPEYGTRDGYNFNIGEKVVFHCFTGFNLIGSVERYCLRNGQWSGELTRCNDKNNFCPDPGVPINGMKSGSWYGEREKVKFRCQPGFFLIGSEVRECLSNKTWSGIEAKCSGAYDFDDVQEVSQVLKRVVAEMAREQEDELAKFNKPRAKGRTIDINYPGRLVLHFIFDVSSCVSKSNFNASINFAKALVKKIGISENGARAGALTFGSKSEIEFLPGEFSTTNSVLEAFDEIQHAEGRSNFRRKITSALQILKEEVIPLTIAMLGRKNMKSIAILLTHGNIYTGGDPEEEAKWLKNAGVEIYCIDITSKARNNGLYRIASEPSDEHVFILNNYQALNWLVQEITNGKINMQFSQCGVRMDNVVRKQQVRIINGENAVEPWPWMAAIYFDKHDGKEPKFICGGTIIHQRWILTAAHCLAGKQERNIIIKLGLTDLKKNTSLQKFDVGNLFSHPKYNYQNHFDYDIALISLNGLIEFNTNVRPVCIPDMELPADTNLYKPHENTWVIGWGYTEKVGTYERVNAKITSNLKELRLPLQPRERCENSLSTILPENPKEIFTERMFCAGTGQGDGDACIGDSGGPIMQSQFKDDAVYWTIIGIVSWGTGCGQINTYGYYTHVYSLLPWMFTTMDALDKE